MTTKEDIRYKKIEELPDILKQALPERAQKIYLKAYEESWENYDKDKGGEMSIEGVAHRDAMHAVLDEYVLNEEKGKWYKKGDQPSEEDEDKGIVQEIIDAVKIDEIVERFKGD